MNLRVGIDVGGTFTDVNAFDENSGELVAIRKYLSDPGQPAPHPVRHTALVFFGVEAGLLLAMITTVVIAAYRPVKVTAAGANVPSSSLFPPDARSVSLMLSTASNRNFLFVSRSFGNAMVIFCLPLHRQRLRIIAATPPVGLLIPSALIVPI